jgi:hypothetical protein
MQQESVRGRRHDGAGHRRTERAHGLSCRSGGEFFYQLKGDVVLKVVDAGQI